MRRRKHLDGLAEPLDLNIGQAGRSNFLKIASICALTSLVLPICVKVPRPNSAAFRMKWLFGAEPIPMVNRRLRPSCVRMTPNNSSSFPTWPSVRNITCLRCVDGAVPWRAILSAGKNLGAPVGFQLLDILNGLAEGLRPNRLSLRKEYMSHTVELDHVEPVLRRQAIRGQQERGPGLFDRRASHRAGGVDDKDRFAQAESAALVRAGGMTIRSRSVRRPATR